MKDKFTIIGCSAFTGILAIYAARACTSYVKKPSKPSSGEHAFRPSNEERFAIKLARKDSKS
jgi:hypothetical protein